ncbi:MAG: hypothetical protein GF334_08240 [Candidatus Altiarchaeales archaeon]|nr:hypothetical protein [Candidatus Altiarchaeales archaeon]
MSLGKKAENVFEVLRRKLTGSDTGWCMAIGHVMRDGPPEHDPVWMVLREETGAEYLISSGNGIKISPEIMQGDPVQAILGKDWDIEWRPLQQMQDIRFLEETDERLKRACEKLNLSSGTR